MAFLGDVFNFEQFKLGNMWDKVKKNPEQLLLGAGDPASAKMWGKVTGKDYEPLVDQWGGATKDDYSKAEANGIDTKAGGQMHALAQVIAKYYTGKWLDGVTDGEATGSGLLPNGDSPQTFGQGLAGTDGAGNQTAQPGMQSTAAAWKPKETPMTTQQEVTAQSIARRRALAETLLQQSIQPRIGQIVGGHYIRGNNSFAPLLQQFAGNRQSERADEEERGLRADLSAGLDKFLSTRQGSPGRAMTSDETTDYYLNGQKPEGVEPIAADPRRAVLEAMASKHPELRQIGQIELQAMLKPKGGGLEVKDLLPYANPESIPQLLAQGAGAFQPKAGKREVQDVSIGGGQWQSFEVGPDGRVDMQRPIGQPFSKRPTASDISLTNGDGVPKDLARAQPEIFKETRGQAQSAIRQIQTSDRIERLAQDPQIVAGALARPELLLQSLGAKLGLTGPEAATKTQAMMRELAQATLVNVKQLPGPLSEKELPFLEAASAGQIEFTPEAILRIARLQKAAAHNSLMDAYSVYKSNTGLAGGESYKQAYPLPRQGSYQLDPSVYEVDDGNMATLRELPSKPSTAPKAPIVKNWN